MDIEIKNVEAKEHSLIITVESPEGVSDEDLVAYVAGMLERADAVHRANGGSGLQIKSVKAYEVKPG